MRISCMRLILSSVYLSFSLSLIFFSNSFCFFFVFFFCLFLCLHLFLCLSVWLCLSFSSRSLSLSLSLSFPLTLTSISVSYFPPFFSPSEKKSHSFSQDFKAMGQGISFTVSGNFYLPLWQSRSFSFSRPFSLQSWRHSVDITISGLD